MTRNASTHVSPRPGQQPQAGGWLFMIRALRHRNFRLYFIGQSISLVGTWMTRIATSWLVYRLTGSALLLGIVGFAGQIPSFLLGPIAGVFVDRWDRHRLLVVTQALAMVQSLTLAVLTLPARITVREVLLLSVVQGVINAFDMPARQTFMVELVEKQDDLANAIAMNSSMVNVARLLGPSLGGVLIAAVGEGWCFLLDGISYLAVIASLRLMTVSSNRQQGKTVGHLGQQLSEGWTYISCFLPIRNILLLLAVVSIVGMPYTVLMPLVADDILHGGPQTLGLLMAAVGIGALGGAGILAVRKSVLGLGKLLPLATITFGLGLIAFSFSRQLWLSWMCLVITGLGFMIQMTSSNTLLQTIVDSDKRGRVMSFYTMAVMGLAPFGSLLAGGVAHTLGVEATLRYGGIGCIIAACWFARTLPLLRLIVRPIYVKIGILSEPAPDNPHTAEPSSTR
ncbi:MAG: MFS transporter [Candidatus Binatia bacterium]